MSLKVENMLDLTLNTEEDLREKSPDLHIGYDAEQKTWELIVKYSQTLEPLRALGISIVYLLNNYAILKSRKQHFRRLWIFRGLSTLKNPKRPVFC